MKTKHTLSTMTNADSLQFPPDSGAPGAAHGTAVGDAQQRLAEQSIQRNQYEECLAAAAEGGDESLLALLLTAGADPNVTDADGDTPLMLAASYGRIGAIRLLLAAGADPHCLGWSPLHVAVVRDDAGQTRRLIAAGEDFHAHDFNGDAPLQLALYYGSFGSLEALLEAGADSREAGWSPLHRAAALGDASAIREWIASGADPNAKDDQDNTPLMLAALGCHDEALRVLIEAGADAAGLCWSALHLAAIRNDAGAVHELLDEGADPCVRDAVCRKPRDYASGSEYALVHALLAAAESPVVL